MSQMTIYQNVKNTVLALEPNFAKLAEQHGIVNFRAEANFALQALRSNAFACKIAQNNADSLRMAVMNVAAIGLSLNPIEKHAYLVPRDGKIMLDVSYMGYLHLAVSSGSIKWGKAEIVYKQDEFIFNGIGREPTHRIKNVFGDRGEIVGAYVVVKTHDDSYLTEIMGIDEIFRIRDRSQSYKAYKSKGVSTPWVTDQGEMIKKTVIKRAAKTWPRKTEDTRLNTAIQNSNDLDGIDFELEKRNKFLKASEEDMKEAIRLRMTTHPEEFKKGPFYKVPFGKFAGMQLKDLDLPEIEAEVARIEKIMTTKENFPSWYDEVHEYLSDYVTFYPEYSAAFVTEEELEEN